eukprot:s5028_g2.t1
MAEVFDTAPVASVQSKYQKIEVLKSDFFGHILTIDGDLMLTERDELLGLHDYASRRRNRSGSEFPL